MLGNDRITPELLLGMAAGAGQGDNILQGMSGMFGNASNIMAVQKQEQQVKQAENATRTWLQKQFPNEDMSSMPAPMMRLYAEQAFKQKFAPIEKAEFKTLPDGTYGAWDGQKLNILGKAEKPEDIPAAYQDFLKQQEDPAYKAFKDEEKVAKDAPTTKDKMDAEMDIRKTYRAEPNVKAYQTVKTAYQRGRQAAAMDSAAGDMSLVYAFMKMQDPESVVREGEYATAEKAGSAQDWVVNIYNRVRTGQRLTAQQKADFVKAMDEQYQIASGSLEDTNKQYEPYIEEYGLPKERLITQPEKFEPLNLTPGQKVTSKDKAGNEVMIERLPEP